MNQNRRNLVLVGRPKGAPSMYNAHSTYSSAIRSSVVESTSEKKKKKPWKCSRVHFKVGGNRDVVGQILVKFGTDITDLNQWLSLWKNFWLELVAEFINLIVSRENLGEYTWVGGFSGRQTALQAVDSESEGKIDVARQEESELVPAHRS